MHVAKTFPHLRAKGLLITELATASASSVKH